MNAVNSLHATYILPNFVLHAHGCRTATDYFILHSATRATVTASVTVTKLPTSITVGKCYVTSIQPHPPNVTPLTILAEVTV